MSHDVARLRWRCRRGMRELDAVLHAFLDRSIDSLGADDIARLELILDLPDPELHGYLIRRSVPADPAIAALIDRIRSTFAA